MESSSQLTIIATSWNRSDLTKKFLKHLLDIKYDFILVLIDNASSDRTRDWLIRIKDPRLKLVLNPSNYGLSYAYQQGLAIAKTDFIIFTQNDCFPQIEALKNSVDFLKAHPDVACLGTGGGFLVDYKIHEITGLNGDDYMGYQQVRNFEPIDVDFVAGFYMACNRKVLIAHHIQFDPTYNPFWEDVDFCRQISRANFRCLMMSKRDYPIHHIRTASITPLLGEKEREKRRLQSFDYFKSKWSPGKRTVEEIRQWK